MCVCVCKRGGGFNQCGGGVIGKIHELSSSSMHCHFLVDLLYTQLWTISQFPSIFDLNFLVGELVNMISASRPLLD